MPLVDFGKQAALMVDLICLLQSVNQDTRKTPVSEDIQKILDMTDITNIRLMTSLRAGYVTLLNVKTTAEPRS